MQAGGDDKPYDDINITPMLDLSYVLLVIFILMCTASVQGMKVNLPKASNAPQSLSKPKTKANPAGAVTVTTVVVTNSRKADLVELQAAESGSANWKEVLGPLKSGKQASAKLPQASDCRFDLRGTFDDGQSMDASGVNVCADKTLNLTD